MPRGNHWIGLAADSYATVQNRQSSSALIIFDHVLNPLARACERFVLSLAIRASIVNDTLSSDKVSAFTGAEHDDNILNYILIVSGCKCDTTRQVDEMSK